MNRPTNERVKFFLPARNFNGTHGGFSQMTMQGILRQAFGMTHCKSATLMARFKKGFWITCRPSQFARFIVYRAETGEGINGIKDLQPELFVLEPKPNAYVILAEAVGDISVSAAQRMADLMGITPVDIRRLLCFDSRAAEPVVVDVSKNKFYRGFNNEHNTEETYAC